MTEALYSGSCLCKKVSFEIHGEFTGFFFCHCSRCRKETGSAHASNLFSTTAELKWVSGQESVKTYHLSNTRFSKSFCEHCGSALPAIKDGRLLVPAGGLDCDVNIKPNAHIFVGSKANWDHGLELVAKFEDLPSCFA
jgi:hypothetical protein